MPQNHVAVVVLGDLGRSPRMQYHCLSLARAGANVSFIGYDEEKCTQELESSPRITKHGLSTPFNGCSRKLFLLWAPFKVLFQILQLLWVLLFAIKAPSAILVQNPPSIPTMFVAFIASRLRGARFVIDWHNFGYTILQQTAGGGRASHPLVQAARVYERVLGQTADGGLCVTRAMQGWLRDEWGVSAHVLHDKPPAFFRPLGVDEAHELFLRLQREGTFGAKSFEALVEQGGPGTGDSKDQGVEKGRLDRMEEEEDEEDDGEVTMFTTSSSSSSSSSQVEAPHWRQDRPALMVSGTSWTPDEDFGLLLEALVLYDRAAVESRGAGGEPGNSDAGGGEQGQQEEDAQRDGQKQSRRRRRGSKDLSKDLSKGNAKNKASGKGRRLPRLVVVVTGKGPQKAMYEQKIRNQKWTHVQVRTAWLASADYPRLLGSADLGVSLHTSSSGLDLPMKVVDMFGAGLPVLAARFACVEELVREGENGGLFEDADGLAGHLVRLLDGWGGGGGVTSDGVTSGGPLDRLRAAVLRAREQDGWEENWVSNARPVLLPGGMRGGGEHDDESIVDGPGEGEEAGSGAGETPGRAQGRRKKKDE